MTNRNLCNPTAQLHKLQSLKKNRMFLWSCTFTSILHKVGHGVGEESIGFGSFVDSRKKNAVQVRSCTQDILKETPVCSRRHSLLLTLTSPISEAWFNNLLFILELNFIISIVWRTKSPHYTDLHNHQMMFKEQCSLIL